MTRTPFDRDPFEEGERKYLLDEDVAAEQVAELISSITHNEVDGDGTPWWIVLAHLAGVASIIADVRDRFPEADAYLTDEYCWIRDTSVTL